MSAPRRLVAAACACIVVPGVLAGCGSSGERGGGSSSASCAAVVELDGHTYWGTGDLRRRPGTTGRTLSAVVPACDDTGGQDADPFGDRAVRVRELAGVDPTVAVLFDGAVYARHPRSLPDAVRAWLRSPRCSAPGTLGAPTTSGRCRSTDR